jgi:hypothetical protein
MDQDRYSSPVDDIIQLSDEEPKPAAAAEEHSQLTNRRPELPNRRSGLRRTETWEESSEAPVVCSDDGPLTEDASSSRRNRHSTNLKKVQGEA